MKITETLTWQAPNLGTFLKEAREAAGKSQAETARHMGVTKYRISHLETGYKKTVNLGFLRRLSVFYGLEEWTVANSCGKIVLETNGTTENRR
ncbi:MAG: helix-turn-helix domain-containing protein [Moorea sp. SIO4G2]|nr:helix-turn-helix domain-containing protein [Moorena sp. SIO4G2]